MGLPLHLYQSIGPKNKRRILGSGLARRLAWHLTAYKLLKILDPRLAPRQMCLTSCQARVHD